MDRGVKGVVLAGVIVCVIGLFLRRAEWGPVPSSLRS
jgi:hypothetical protein